MSPKSAALPLNQRVQAIVIGASAGGVEALSVLIPALPAQLAAAVLVVLHLPRDGRSLLVEIFSPRCALPVHEALDKEPVKPGHVYFAPSDYHLMVDAGPRIALSVDEPVHFSRPSIDVLFESAVHIYEDGLMGIVLTGGNADGAAGLAAIGRAGGTTVVQQPLGAYASLMPESALKQGRADYVLPLDQIAALLQTLAPAPNPRGAR